MPGLGEEEQDGREEGRKHPAWEAKTVRFDGMTAVTGPTIAAAAAVAPAAGAVAVSVHFMIWLLLTFEKRR